MKEKQLCVQCNREIQTQDGNYNVCIFPDCPNYGLLQLDNNHLNKLIN